MTDAELSKLRKLASQALGKAINHLEQTELETLRASREFEAKIFEFEHAQGSSSNLCYLFNFTE